MITRTGNKRYICSFVKEVDGEPKVNVVVIAAANNIIARAKLCEFYGVLNQDIPAGYKLNDIEGIKSIRLSDTNTYEGEESDENFGYRSEARGQVSQSEEIQEDRQADILDS